MSALPPKADIITAAGRCAIMATSVAATAGFAIRCLELAATAPNDKIRNALLTIAQISETETAADDRA
jgi:hypothetical protein